MLPGLPAGVKPEGRTPETRPVALARSPASPGGTKGRAEGSAAGGPQARRTVTARAGAQWVATRVSWGERSSRGNGKNIVSVTVATVSTSIV